MRFDHDAALVLGSRSHSRQRLYRERRGPKRVIYVEVTCHGKEASAAALGSNAGNGCEDFPLLRFDERDLDFLLWLASAPFREGPFLGGVDRVLQGLVLRSGYGISGGFGVGPRILENPRFRSTNSRQ